MFVVQLFFFTSTLLIPGWFPAKFVEILDERSKEVGTVLVRVYENISTIETVS